MRTLLIKWKSLHDQLNLLSCGPSLPKSSAMQSVFVNISTQWCADPVHEFHQMLLQGSRFKTAQVITWEQAEDIGAQCKKTNEKCSSTTGYKSFIATSNYYHLTFHAKSDVLPHYALTF